MSDFCRYLSVSIALPLIVGLAACGGNDAASRLQRAADYQAAGEYQASQIELKNALRADPDNIDARILLGEVSLQLGQVDAAASEFQKAAGLGADESRIRMPLGEAMFAQRAFDAMLSRFRIAEGDSAADLYEIHHLRGRAHLGLGDTDAARSAFELALSNHPGAAQSILGLAAVANLTGDAAAAGVLIDQALDRSPDRVEAWLAKGQWHLQAGEPALAKAAIQSGLDRAQSGNERALALAGLTEVLIVSNELDDARQSLASLGGISPNVLLISYLRARIAAAAGDYEVAVRVLQQILADYPAHLPSRLLLGVVSFAQGNLATADGYLQSALATDPGNDEARKLLAEIRLRLERPDDVLAVLDSATVAEPADAVLFGLRARARLQLGEYALAVADLERSLAADPADADSRIKLAAAYLLANRRQDAADLLQSWPDGGAETIRRGLLEFLANLQAGETQRAVTNAATLSAGQPHNAGLLYLLGSGFVLAGERDTAAAYFLATLESDAGHVPAMLALASLSELDGDGPAMLDWLQRALAADAQAPAPRLLLARYHLLTGDYQRAEALARELAQAAPDDPVIAEILGLAQLGRGQAALAEQNLAKALRLRPASIDAQVALAVARMAQNDAVGAAQSLARAVELEPENVRVLAMLAGLKVRSGELQQADVLIDRLLAIDPSSVQPYTLRGDVLTARGDHDAAAQMYAQAAKRGISRSLAVRLFNARRRAGAADPAAPLRTWLTDNPDDVEIRLMLAQAYQSAARGAEARQQYELLLETNATHTVALNNLAWLSHAAGRNDALDLAARAYQSSPESAAVADTYGWMLVLAGELDKGIAMLQLAVRQAPDIGEIRFHLAAALARSGENAEARSLLTELLESGESFDSREEAIALLQTL